MSAFVRVRYLRRNTLSIRPGEGDPFTQKPCLGLRWRLRTECSSQQSVILAHAHRDFAYPMVSPKRSNPPAGCLPVLDVLFMLLDLASWLISIQPTAAVITPTQRGVSTRFAIGPTKGKGVLCQLCPQEPLGVYCCAQRPEQQHNHATTYNVEDNFGNKDFGCSNKRSARRGSRRIESKDSIDQPGSDFVRQ